jgi:hypothetical protein
MDSDLSNLREQMIQNIQTDLGLKRSSFPQLSLAGDVIFAYDIEKELELQRSTMGTRRKSAPIFKKLSIQVC